MIISTTGDIVGPRTAIDLESSRRDRPIGPRVVEKVNVLLDVLPRRRCTVTFGATPGRSRGLHVRVEQVLLFNQGTPEGPLREKRRSVTRLMFF